MSDLECNRIGCENIMCERYSNIYGYICNDCYSEMVIAQAIIGNFSIKKFMETPKHEIDDSDVDLNDVFVV